MEMHTSICFDAEYQQGSQDLKSSEIVYNVLVLHLIQCVFRSTVSSPELFPWLMQSSALCSSTLRLLACGKAFCNIRLQFASDLFILLEP